MVFVDFWGASTPSKAASLNTDLGGTTDNPAALGSQSEPGPACHYVCPCSTRTPSHKEDLHIHKWVKRYTHTKIPLQGIPLRYWYCLKRKDNFNCIYNCETSLLFFNWKAPVTSSKFACFFSSLPLSVSPFLSTSLFQHNALYGNSYQGKWRIFWDIPRFS